MSKEKVFGLVKKNEKEREKEVTKKCIIISLIFFTLIGVLFIYDTIASIDIFENYLLNGLVQFITFGITICSIIFIGYICSQLSTKKHRLKEIKK